MTLVVLSVQRCLWLSGTGAAVFSLLFLTGCSGRDERVTFYPNGRVRERWHERTVGPNRVVKDGGYEAFYPDGKKQASGEFADGDSVGLWQDWYLMGGNKFEKSFGEQGKPRGRAIVWMPDGDTLEFKTFNDLGELEGRYATFWRDNGELHEQGDYRNGKRNGVWRRWFRNGQPEYEREYDRGRSVGMWIDFGADGRVAARREFLRDLPPELSTLWAEALVDGVPQGRSSIFQKRERQVDTIAAEERDYGTLQRKGSDWIVPFRWRSPRFEAIEKQRLDTLCIWKPR